MNRRLSVIQAIFILFSLGIVLRLGYWQIVKAADLAAEAAWQRQSFLEIPSPRGAILSSDGFPLVTNQEAYLFYVNPRQFIFSEKLSQLLPASASARLANIPANLGWFLIARHLPVSLRDQIQSLKLDAIGFEPDPSRLYPEASSSAHLLGFVGQDSAGRPQGYFGLEGYYNRQLTGLPGKLVQEKDALNRPILIGTSNLLPPQPGSALTTSINRTLQFIAYQKLAAALTRYGAVSGTVSIMEPSTGRILAMVSLPNYDPSDFGRFDQQIYKNPIISDAYEPGSIFKTVVMAAALDAQAVQPDTVCDICTGPVAVSDYVIKTWNDKYYPKSTMTEVIQHSDNVGMVFVSRRLGKRKLISYLKKFGVGQLTGVDLQEESSPQLRPESAWMDIDPATASFGQGIAVTPLQMLRAVSVIANRGLLPKPQVVDKINNKAILPSPPTQVISSMAAAQMALMMVNAVDLGEAKWAKPKGFSIAGKTGTAQIPVSGHYDADKTIASFVGFAPADQPKFAMLITLREPKSSPWGSETAAPLWFDIAREVFRLLK
ncbi:MAG: Peptidoglycan glycosyltransferase [Candidatus Amesbacteria bacterium GW2011_GWB1_47_26]|uniref:Peptidoglycan glycosyltransferase n=1 Tax=Candidatus Amesbacteria bacterium GW2011_GWC2_45_19 TaxID=1618366 RepID=A0A0G1M4T8_9BACT|nr:MAG: Peptidoglycan glycosyltransferase [Candidatus Amesbacteria bacterium GW2011_GWC2_45_19]KKU38598.1 MAG: Peptidoglycan glycosyltransferase [Candidatus Amesbacteria bacterium GW2011_GWA1_46_35]KKU69447.1 MAG: Peptidoglycan glycosyltransferase [Microgenomates group bacterium GW2011_GWC1_47_20]KKU74812.1 MAG: Peptidoglycan glycosyltransferase [Candidatus Amesbacteria bacterium GW2011_GWB1_47_26]